MTTTTKYECGKDCTLCCQSFYCYREEVGEDAYQQAMAATRAADDQQEAEERESHRDGDGPGPWLHEPLSDILAERDQLRAEVETYRRASNT